MGRAGNFCIILKLFNTLWLSASARGGPVRRVLWRKVLGSIVAKFKMYYVYVLINEKGKIYIGQTKDINKRLNDHKRGWSKYTKKKGNWELLFTEEYSTRTEAIKRERYLKSGVGRKYIKEVINGA